VNWLAGSGGGSSSSGVEACDEMVTGGMLMRQVPGGRAGSSARSASHTSTVMATSGESPLELGTLLSIERR